MNCGGSGARGSSVFLYNKRGEQIPRHVTRVRVCPSIKVIDGNAFHRRAKLMEVDLPDGLEGIGDHAFNGCKFLKCTVVPSTVKVKVIGRGAFCNCRQLEHVELSEGLELIEDGAFEYCVSLKQIMIPSTVKVISSNRLTSGGTFEGCEQLEKVELNEGLEQIREVAFSACVSLKSINIPSTVKMISRRAFEGCEQLEEVRIFGGIDQFAEDIFHGCKSLKRIIVPSTVKVISPGAFHDCKQLEEVELCDGLELIERSAFEGCESLKQIKIPSTVKEISDKAFLNCIQLEVIHLSEGIETIHENSFRGCASLSHINVPSTVKMIAANTFSELHQLEMVELCDGLLQIGYCAFIGCKLLKTIKIPSTVKFIEAEAFAHCDNLVEAELPEGVEIIGQSAFSHCKSLKCINIPSSLESICRNTFIGCISLEEVQLCNEVGQMKLEEIKHSAFEGCESLKHIQITPSVRKIYSKAFLNCKQLEVVELFEGLQIIAGHSFWNCTSLKYVRIPASIKVIGDGAFLDCEHLEEVTIGNGVEQVIKSSAFEGCKSLTFIKVPSGVKNIASKAFSQCKQLEVVELCEGLDEIGSYAFKGCSSLKCMKVPSSLRITYTGSFNGCQQLMSLEMEHCTEMKGIDMCSSIRNTLIPNKNHRYSCLFTGCHDLRRLFGEDIQDALRSRFDGLPLHKLCYHHSFHPTQIMLEQIQIVIDSLSDQSDASLTLTLNNQDCLGMTPLHILACSTKQSIDIYKLVIANHPKSLVIEDKWGCPPLLYAIWGNAPPEIIQLLIQSQQYSSPNHTFSWDKLIGTLCRTGASLDTTQRLIGIQQTSFPGNSLDWQSVARELTICCVVQCETIDDFPPLWEAMVEAFLPSEAFGATRTYEELIQYLIEMRQNFFLEGESNGRYAGLRVASEDFIKPVEGCWMSEFLVSLDTFRFLVKCGIPERVDAIRVRKWQLDIETRVNESFGVASQFDDIHSKLVSYEYAFHQLREALCLLELAIWKAKINEYGGHVSEMRGQLRISCGTDVIIPNVVSFLIG